MTLLDLRACLDRLGVRLSLRGDRLVADAPAGSLTGEIKAALLAHKPALVALLARGNDRTDAAGPPAGEPTRPARPDGWGPPPADRSWRRIVAHWPIEWRERWGRRANELQDRGQPWDAAEWIAYCEAARGLVEAERRGEIPESTDLGPAAHDGLSDQEVVPKVGPRDAGSSSPDRPDAVAGEVPGESGPAPGPSSHLPDEIADRAPGIRDPVAGYLLIRGDARRIPLPDESVHCCVTSPPYFRLRDYGVEGQIGRERTPDEYVATMVEVFREVRRVLRPDGTLFLVLGDTYDHGDLIGIPDRVANALQSDGWCWRDRIIWAKAELVGDELEGSCMPGSQRGRCTSSYETVLHLTRGRRSYFDCDGVRAASGAMLRNVWRINTESNPLGHFALMPRELAERCIRLGTSERGCCPNCLAPWRRRVATERVPTRPGHNSKVYVDPVGSPYARHDGRVIGNRDPRRHTTVVRTVGWEPGCPCGVADTVPCRVVDPFGGLATTAVAAIALGRVCITIELNPEYCADALRRLVGAAGPGGPVRG
jgi:site-specific DNA-methyltransferase (adenine-specific)